MNNSRTDVNWEQSRELAKLFGLERRQCYRNAVLSLLSSLALQAEGFVYVEGYVFGFIATPHGWLQNDTEILDPTLALSPLPPHPVQYFAAVVYSLSEVKRFSTRYTMPYVERDDHGGRSIAAYNEAEMAARKAMLHAYQQPKTNTSP